MKKSIPYGHQWIDESDIRAVNTILRGDWLTQGPAIKKFEEELCRYTGARYAVVVSSGTAGLHLACLAAGVSLGDEVITSSLTFLASANCVLYCGAKPVFADCDSLTANITAVSIQQQVSPRTKAIIPVHFAGNSCDMKAVKVIAKENKLIVIEDACHALGASYAGTPVGACQYSDMAVFSFHPVKSITTGEGGAIMTNSFKLYKKLLCLRNHGIVKDGLKNSCGGWYYEMRSLGYNYRMTDIQAALGRSQLLRLPEFLRRRLAIANIYNQRLSGNKFFDIPGPLPKSSWHLYIIRLKDAYLARKAKIFSSLRGSGIGVQVHYIPVHTQPYYRRYVCGSIKRPKAEEFYRRAISIPLYPGMARKDIDNVVNVLLKTFKKVSG